MTARTSAFKTLAARLGALTARERLLLGIAGALLLGLGLFYGVLAPGLSHASSASDRLRVAASDLALTRKLADEHHARRKAADAVKPVSFAGIASDIALQFGLTVQSASLTGDRFSVRVEGASSTALLAWAQAASDRMATGLQSMTLTRLPGARVAGDFTFSRSLDQ